MTGMKSAGDWPRRRPGAVFARLAAIAVAASVAAISMSGLVSNAQETQAAPEIPAQKKFLQETLADVPPDVVFLFNAIIAHQRGIDDPEVIGPVQFEPGVAARLQEPKFRYKGFDLAGVNLLAYRSATGDPDRRFLTGLFHFQDVLKRRAAVRFVADFRRKGNLILVREARVFPLYPQRPEVLFFVVPGKNFDPGLLVNSDSGARLLSQVINRAVAVNRPDKPPLENQAYYVFAFFMDRLAQDAEVGLRIGLKDGDFDKDWKGSTSLVFDGWHVAYLQAKFNFDSDQELFFKAIYTPGSPIPPENRKPRYAGGFSTSLLKNR